MSFLINCIDKSQEGARDNNIKVLTPRRSDLTPLGCREEVETVRKKKN